MEHLGHAVSVNTSEAPYVYRIPAPGTISELSHFYSLLADKQSAAQGSTDVVPDERLPDILRALDSSTTCFNMDPTACCLAEGLGMLLYMGGRKEQSRVPLLTVTGVRGQGKTEALYSIHRDDVVKVGSASLPYTEHIKALFSQHSQWKPVARVLRVFATFNQWTPYNPQWDTVGEGSLLLH